MHEVAADHGVLHGEIILPCAKSHLNRLLALQLLTGGQLQLMYDAAADDVRVMEMALALPEASVIDVGAAGTAMRFLTACFSVLPGKRIITGSDRMKQRPISPLVDALRQLGAKIEYLGEEGYPPVEVTGGLSMGGSVTIRGDVSSQFISALMLIGPFVQGGIKIFFSTPVTSFPYVEMTQAVIGQIGGKVYLTQNEARVEQGFNTNVEIVPEADWSAAAFWLEAAALANHCNIVLRNISLNSIQGDARAMALWSAFGLEITEEVSGVRVTKSGVMNVPTQVDFTDCPDLAQAYAATVAGLGLSCRLTGLKTLRIKETDRISALQRELQKLGCAIHVGSDWLEISPAVVRPIGPLSFDTYDDHRMAMCLAPLALVIGRIYINNPQVVSKSYPDFFETWTSMK